MNLNVTLQNSETVRRYRKKTQFPVHITRKKRIQKKKTKKIHHLVSANPFRTFENIIKNPKASLVLQNNIV